MRKLYGYTMILVGSEQALGIPDQEEAKNITFIYESYLEGHSLGGIVKLLYETQIPSPTGKETWGRAAIDQHLSNEKYITAPLVKHFSSKYSRKNKIAVMWVNHKGHLLANQPIIVPKEKILTILSCDFLV